ncbi:WW domain-binding protein 4 [Genypterus blacodes]|uniref:WW domain-binding protein 4 n=1 Tax=Genypterus blacodes TaxID=154954 RepID=UPI003F75EE17
MADYWKSQPRKFCQYCKCWIADNKPSIEFHERGKNHKENVAAKISEIKKKSIEKVKQEERMSKEFAAMEEAAMKAYEEDLKRMATESGFQAPTAAPVPSPALAQTQTQTQTQARPPTGARTQIGPQLGPHASSQAQRQPQGQQKGKRKQKKEHGKHPYKHRGPPPAQTWVEGTSDDGHKYYYNTRTGESKWENPEGFQGGSSDSAQTLQNSAGQNEKPSCATWKEAVSPDGYTYYYNSDTGESSWERPADFPPSEAAESGRSQEGESQAEASSPQPEPLPAGEETSNGAPASQQDAQDAGRDGQESGVPKISLRKRNAEAEPSENEREDKASRNTPKEDTEEKKREEDTQSQSLRPEPEEEKVVPVIRYKRKANPYGAWEKIKEEVDPYLKVDLQLPKVEEVCTSGPPEPPPEPKPKFRERIITSLGTEGGPTSFRKSKMANGKSRSIRRRDDDD